MSLPADKLYFEAIPWCSALLADPDWRIIPTRSRTPKPGKEDEFFARTLATQETISACLTQSRNTDHNRTGARSSTAPGTATLRPSITEVRTLFALSAGVNGYPGVAHGGFVAAVLDEVMGLLMTANKDQYESLSSNVVAVQEPGVAEQKRPRFTTVTAELTIRYRRPVFTGGMVLARAWFAEVQASKFVLLATVEDRERKVLSEGHGVFVVPKAGKGDAFRKTLPPKI